MIQKDGMYSVVTAGAGAGVWGPNMRIGTNSKIVIIDAVFQEE